MKSWLGYLSSRGNEGGSSPQKREEVAEPIDEASAVVCEARPEVPYARSSEIISQKATSETMLFCMATGQYFSLNAIGTRIWEMSDGMQTPRQIAATLAAEYEVEPSTILGDVLEVTSHLASNGLLHKQADSR